MALNCQNTSQIACYGCEKLKNIKPDPKISETVCNRDWHNVRSYLFFNVRKFRTQCAMTCTVLKWLTDDLLIWANKQHICNIFGIQRKTRDVIKQPSSHSHDKQQGISFTLSCQFLCCSTVEYVTLEHKSSLKSLGYIYSNSQKYTVWVKIIDFSFMPKIIMILSKDHVPWRYLVNFLP